MSFSPWDVLDLPPSSDRDTIRRQYARKLREVRDDAAAFQQLREAYEQALALAAQAGPVAAVDVVDETPAAAVATTTAEAEAADAPADDATEEDTQGSLSVHRDDVAAAERWLPRFRPLAGDSEVLAAEILDYVHHLTLERRNSLEQFLAILLTHERRLSTDAVADVALALGWDDQVGLNRRGGVFAAPVFQQRLYGLLAERENPTLRHEPLGLQGQILVGSLFVFAAWVLVRLLSHALDQPWLSRLPVDSYVWYLWLAMAAGVVLRRWLRPWQERRRLQREAERTRIH